MGWESFKFLHPWPARLVEYFSCLAVVVLACCFLFRELNIFHTNAESARYLLSALVQSQASVVAIVVSLTLIAVQLTASAYSPRVVDIFKRNPDLWLLLFFYGLSMFYGLGVLKLVEAAGGAGGAGGEAVSDSLEFWVSLAFWLGAFTFVALFLYLWNIFELLKAEEIVKRLAVGITREKILKAEDKEEEDPILPVLDVVRSAIMKYDFATTRVGLKAVTERVAEILGSESAGKGEEEISKRFCRHLERVGRLAASREDEESVWEVIENLEKFGETTVKRELKKATENVVLFLGAVVGAAAEKGLESGLIKAVYSFEKIGKKAVEKDFSIAVINTTIYLGLIGITAVEKGLKRAAQRAGFSLAEIGRIAAAKGHIEEVKEATFLAAKYLGKLGSTAAEKGLEDIILDAMFNLDFVGSTSERNGLERATKEVVRSFGEIGRKSVEKGFKNSAESAAFYLTILTLSSEEVVKTAIQDYESRLKEEDRDAFQKFKKIYEQELEELRAKKRRNAG